MCSLSGSLFVVVCCLLLILFKYVNETFFGVKMDEESPSLTNTDESKKYWVRGVEVVFPYKAYPSQLSMMDRIITGLVKSQNCLIESPTGSGKSLALLCAALAWQRKYEKDFVLISSELEAKIQNTNNILSTNKTEENVSRFTFNQETPNKIDFKNNCAAESFTKTPQLNNFKFTQPMKFVPTHPPYFDDEDDDFQPVKKRIHLMSPNSLSNQNKSNICESTKIIADKNTEQVSSSVNILDTGIKLNESANETKLEKSFDLKQQTLKKTPKIFFGTRTHKQISQIIRELKKTIYKDTKITILSSRERTCINPVVMKEKNKQEACSELIYDPDGPGCIYYRNHRKVSHNNPSRFKEAFDIEELVSKLKTMRCCPYFSARVLVADSDIIFCPYNYLIDPLIRTSLDINLNNNVLILDEAHNIEDTARDSASLIIIHYQILDAINDLNKVAPQYGKISNSYYAVCNILSTFHGWFVDSASLVTQKSFESATKIYSGFEMVAVLEHIGIGPDKFEDFKKLTNNIFEIENDQENVTENELKLTSGTLSLLKSLVCIINYIYKDDMKFMPDYKFILSRKRNSFTNPSTSTRPNSELSVNFCCLNPAVAFSDIKDNIHTLIVASGTLSPMISFQSELDMPFEIMLEANHVVSRSQMWIGSIGHGPGGSALSATYHNTETYVFQDDIGKLVLEICSIIPFGVLCFVSSYGMLDKLTSRWQTTGLWSFLQRYKVIICEPKGQTKNFDQTIAEYYRVVEESKTRDDINGALLIAVCRGKVSEGLDFADDNARAVITIGIPFPNFKDTQVELKRKYNDTNRSQKKIMSGTEWYECQAFRALNQALGRCIRHRNDFGALIIVDERFQKQQRYVNCLSKWIRKEIVHYASSVAALNSLKDFSIRTNLNSDNSSTMSSVNAAVSDDIKIEF